MAKIVSALWPSEGGSEKPKDLAAGFGSAENAVEALNKMLTI